MYLDIYSQHSSFEAAHHHGNHLAWKNFGFDGIATWITIIASIFTVSNDRNYVVLSFINENIRSSNRVRTFIACTQTKIFSFFFSSLSHEFPFFFFYNTSVQRRRCLTVVPIPTVSVYMRLQ